MNFSGSKSDFFSHNRTVSLTQFRSESWQVQTPRYPRYWEHTRRSIAWSPWRSPRALCRNRYGREVDECEERRAVCFRNRYSRDRQMLRFYRCTIVPNINPPSKDLRQTEDNTTSNESNAFVRWIKKLSIFRYSIRYWKKNRGVCRFSPVGGKFVHLNDETHQILRITVFSWLSYEATRLHLTTLW